MYDEEGSLLGEYGMGGAQSAGQSQYIYLPTAQGPIPMAAEIDNRLYAIHTDHLGTPRRLTQADGQAAWQWAYTPYGDEAPTLGAKRFTNETTNPTTGATNIAPVRFNLRYPGQYFDEESGLHYNYFRSYDPRTGRYTQGDPIGLDGGWNRFAYVNGDPLNGIDPDGLHPLAIRLYNAAQGAWYRYAPALTEFIAGASGVNGAVVSPMSPLVAQIPTTVSRMTPVARAVAEGVESGGFCSANTGRVIKLSDGFYEAANSPFKFSEYYYHKLWGTGRGAPFLQAEEVLSTATSVAPDRMAGFYRYVNGNLEMVYNPVSKEVWHLMPTR